MERRIDRAKKVAEIWMLSRADSGVSQEWIAMELGVSKKTIQNWEKGISCPTIMQCFEWFRALKLNPYPYLIECLHPELFEDSDDEEDLDKELTKQLDFMSITEKKQLLYLIKGNHGSSWYPLLQMFVAHCQTNMDSRVLTAMHILNCYEMDQNKRENNVKPEVDMLKEAINNAKQSVLQNKENYFL